METIFSDYGIVVLQEHGQYYLRFNSGELASKRITMPVTKADAEKAQQGPTAAYRVIIALQNKEMGLTE